MDNLNIDIANELPKNVQEKITQGHIKDEAKHGIICNYKPFFLVLKDGENIIGSLEAYIAFSEIYVDDLWVDPKYRSKGYGKALLLKLEEQYENKGYNNINLVTSQFQAPEFYKKCGFTAEFTRINKYNPKLSKTFFIKYFKNQVQDKGIVS